MKMQMTPKCTNCQRRFPIFDDGSGMPWMITAEQKDGSKVHLCRYCMMEVGQMTEEEANKFFDNLTGGDSKNV